MEFFDKTFQSHVDLRCESTRKWKFVQFGFPGDVIRSHQNSKTIQTQIELLLENSFKGCTNSSCYAKTTCSNSLAIISSGENKDADEQIVLARFVEPPQDICERANQAAVQSEFFSGELRDKPSREQLNHILFAGC